MNNLFLKHFRIGSQFSIVVTDDSIEDSYKQS